MGTLRDMARTGLLAACLGLGAMAAGSMLDRARFKEGNPNAIGWIERKKAVALEDGHSVEWYDNRLVDLRSERNYSHYWAAGYVVAAAAAAIGREFIRRD
jgi:hypothetical protein